jgi:ribosomal protein L11
MSKAPYGSRIGHVCLRSIVFCETILKEAHDSDYSIHPGSIKMYQDLKRKYWWYGLKRDVATHMAMCEVCQRVKAEHQRQAGLVYPLKIPEWKWE